MSQNTVDKLLEKVGELSSLSHSPSDCPNKESFDRVAERVGELEVVNAYRRGQFIMLGAIGGLIGSLVVAVLAGIILYMVTRK